MEVTITKYDSGIRVITVGVVPPPSEGLEVYTITNISENEVVRIKAIAPEAAQKILSLYLK